MEVYSVCIFIAENGKEVHISVDSEIQKVNVAEINFYRVGKWTISIQYDCYRYQKIIGPRGAYEIDRWRLFEKVSKYQ